MTRSVADLAGCAQSHLDTYTDPANDYAWWTYDRQGDPDTIEPPDVCAIVLLDTRVEPRTVAAMFAPRGDVNPYAELRARMQEALDDQQLADLQFADVPTGHLTAEEWTGRWGKVRAVMGAAQRCDGLSPVFASKVLHRKRPELIPIMDSLLLGFYGQPTSSWSSATFFERIQADLVNNLEMVDGWRANRRTAEDREMSAIRAMDIVIWYHLDSGCDAGTP